MKPLFDLDTYSARRRAFLEGLGDAVAIVPSAPSRTKSHDIEHPYRPSNDLLYLTGLHEPGAMAVMFSEPQPGLVLFVLPRDPKKETWDGPRVGVEGAADSYGATAAHPIAELEAELGALLAGRSAIYYALDVDGELDRRLFAVLGSLRGTRGKPNRAPAAIVDPRPRLYDLRRVKSPAEIAIIREAADIAVEAHVEAMRRVRPGMMEYEVAALIDFACRRRGAALPGYETIVGGGANATVLHYVRNGDVLADGEMVLIDGGAEYRFYNSDITRTFPVGRAFSPAQRDVYEAVLAIQKEAIAKVMPGESGYEMTQWSKRRTTEALVDLGLLAGDVDGLVEGKAHERFYPHGLGHYLGMDVHDVGTYRVDEETPLPLEPGVVLTIEPGIYIPADAEDVPAEMRGIGVRIEDDVLVTEQGHEVLTTGVPKEVQEIETLRREALE